MAETGGQTVMETARLLLRRERDGDRGEWAARINTAEVMAWLGGPQSAEALANNFDRMAQSDLPFLLIERREDGQLIGKCGLSRIETPHAPTELSGQIQVGWTLRADCWGQGYAGEAARATVDHAFAGLDCDRVFGQTSESNRRSWRLMEKLGMRREYRLDYPDPDYPPEDNPTIVFAVDRQDWVRLHG